MNKEKTFIIFERLLWRIRYIILFPVFFLILALFYLVFLMGERMREATEALMIEHSPFETLVYLIDIVDFTLIAVIILLIIRGVYEIFIRDMAIETSKVQANNVLIHDIDELKQKLGKVVIISLVVHVFKQALAIHITAIDDLLLLSGIVLLLAIALYLTDKMGSTTTCCEDEKHDDIVSSLPGKTDTLG